MYHFIINPVSSSGKGSETWEKLKKILDTEHVAYKAHLLQSAEDAEIVAGRLTSGMDDIIHLVVLGGDGTLNGVLQGISDFSRTRLSCIRTGSGNDFVRNMNLPTDPEEALKALLHNPGEHHLDYGVVEYEMEDGSKTSRRFIISCGIGYDADICEEVERSKLKRILNFLHLGKLVYVMIGIKQIMTRKCVPTIVKMDDQEIRLPGLFFTVGMIHQFEGGGVPFCPDANPSDGLLDVCVAGRMSKWKLLIAVTLVYAKKHTLFKNINTYRCKELTVDPMAAQWIHTDGEVPAKAKKVVMHCEPGLVLID